jgi:hypothetical protein
VVSRNGREGTVLLDSGELVTGESMGAGNKLELKRNPVYFGKLLVLILIKDFLNIKLYL